MKHIVIVGATSGLGLGVAEVYARAGWRVGVAGRNAKVLQELCRKYPENVVSARIDVVADDAPSQLLDLISRTGGMDIYLHVAGICRENPALDLKADLDTVRTNVLGFTAMVNTAYHWYASAGKVGRIAAITSVAGTRGTADLASYSASKRYQWTYIDALEQQANRDGVPVRFTDIRPGWTATPLVTPGKHYMMLMDEKTVVADIVKALIAGRRVAWIDLRWHLLNALWRRIPSRLWAHLPVRI